MINIAIVNTYAGCGKDTFSEMLKIELIKVRRKANLLRLAAPGYEIAEKYFNTSDRTVLIGILEGLRKSINEDIWIDYAIQKIDREKINILIDTRQENELLKAKDNYFIPVVLDISKEKSLELQNMRNKEYGKAIISSDEFFNSKSEIGAYEYCLKNKEGIIIKNEGTLEDLQKKANSLIIAIHLYDLCDSLGMITTNGFITKENNSDIKYFLEQLEDFYKKNISFYGGILTKEKLV